MTLLGTTPRSPHTFATSAQTSCSEGLISHTSDPLRTCVSAPQRARFGTLACDILCQKADLPRYNCNLEIIGDDVRDTEHKPMPEEPDSDLEDCSQEIAKLPLITVDTEKHFTKTPTYKQEIKYLLQCKGSPRVVELLGRSEDGLLVFPKFARSFDSTVVSNKDQGRIQNIKRWMLDIIDGVAYLHALGIIHRDLTIRNILEAAPLVLCDLQCKYATYHPPELRPWDETQFSPASDVFALGGVLWEVCYFNNPPNHHVLQMTPPPPPFLDIFLACTRARAEERPSLAELRAMYEKV
ncbi:kinase-like domain-containing protein [Pholiota molesta]|nr:kinase-like domain-containing protein [Pholiota molesta]